MPKIPGAAINGAGAAGSKTVATNNVTRPISMEGRIQLTPDMPGFDEDEAKYLTKGAALKMVNTLNAHITKRANEKLAGISDTLRNAFDYVTGNNGMLPAGGYGVGAAGLGAMAGSRLGTPGMIGGALLGGALGYGGANAINQQGVRQDTMDTAIIGGMGAGLGANDQTDAIQNEQINELGQAVNMLGSMMMGGMDPMSQDMSMGSAMPDMQGAPPSMTGNPGMNGMAGAGSKKQGSVNIDMMARNIARRILGRS